MTVVKRLAAMAVAVAVSVVSAPAALGQTGPRFQVSSAAGRPGMEVVLSQVDPCPAGTDNTVARFIDAAGGVFTSMGTWMPTNPDGSWLAAPRFLLPVNGMGQGGPYLPSREPVPGAGQFTVDCQREGGTTHSYEPEPFTVTARSPRFTVDPPLVRPGSTVTIRSTDGCPTGQAVRGQIGNLNLHFAEPFDPADASWRVEVEIPTKYQDFMLGEVDFPLGTYAISATCVTDGSWAPLAYYATGLLEVRTAPVRYIALGDSFSSGQGAGNYTDGCYRSGNAYAHAVAVGLGFGTPNLAACGGAVTGEVTQASLGGQAFELTTLTEAVTLTVGGNDAQFADVMAACVSSPLHTGAGCGTDQALNDDVAARLAILDGTAWDPMDYRHRPLLHVYRTIHGQAPNAHIYVAGYPDLFGDDYRDYTFTPVGYECWFGGPFISITYADALWLNQQALALNIKIGQAVNAARAEGIPITYVPPTPFDGHGLCDTDTAWFTGVLLNPDWSVNPETFHPNASGQSAGYAPAFLAAMTPR
ncbi:SGNH/GDSL hydrolase family protein [Actinokineospora cianjurensis]|uniref:GDSL-like lipase/acylhydrolase family protein n=1 Tax=Actinokineospora cianjurensis TaxID=585224 RepID=A0A421B102_9PSEU|nr:SGNH/GDSL hydrolase family protein [Actinokineospora cianjurensis]RLK58040.1 GDSL-like lipase/acylhydrolase family protein [Actinokineospora cianjurensis]